MQLLKQKIRFLPNKDQNIQFVLKEDTKSNGLQQDIDNLIAEETGLSINDVEDGEKFRYLPDSTETLKAYFYSGGTYDTSYENAGFTSGETSSRNEVILRSFYIMQVYDSVSTENQTLLHTGYFNGYNFIRIDDQTTVYAYDSEDEFSYLYLPQWYIDSLSGQTTTLYGKISFYNAKTGKLQLFSHATQGFPASYKEPTVDADLYFDLDLDPINFSYDGGTIYAYEIQNTEYTNKINRTISSFDNKKPTYPTGNTFINTGRYIEN
jgi:hypothetical protein